MTIHHLVTDSFSSTILMQDFMTIYRQLAQGQPVRLPPKTTSFRQWNQRLVEYAYSPAIQQEFELWQAKPGEALPGIPLPDLPNPSFIFKSAYLISGTLDVKETRILLQNVLKAHNIQLIELMLAVMAESIGQMKGERSLYVDILRHGRDIPLDRVDLSRTVGWFVIHHPLLLKLDHAKSLEEALPLVKEQYRRPLNGGASYDLLRYMSGNDEMKKTLMPRPLLVFSHDSVQSAPAETFLHTVPKPIRNNTTLQLSWPYLLELRTMLVEGKQLRWVWTSGETVYHRSTVEKLSERFGEIIKKLCGS